MAATHVDLFNCSRLAEWLEEQSKLPDGAKFATSLRAVMAGFVAATDPTPPPATGKLIRCIKADLEPSDKMLDAFLAEWAEPATPPAPESPEAASPWKCSICGAPVRIGDDLRPWHMNGPTSHEAELSDADLKFLADGLRLTD